MREKLAAKGKYEVLAVFLIIFLILTTYAIYSKSRKRTTQKVAGVKTSTQPTAFPSLSPTPAPSLAAKIIVHSRKVGIGVVVDDYSNNSGELTALENELFGKISEVSTYKQFGLPYNNSLDLNSLSYIKSHGMGLIIAWEPWDPRRGMSQSVDYLNEIISGKQDSYIKSFAGQVKAYASPVTIRFAHEMNGNWYPWGGHPHEFVLAYQRIYELFKNEGVGNVKWMWSINASPMVDFDSYYPGEGYVDLIGIDGYNYGNTNANSTWVTFSQVFSGAYSYAVKHGKPIYISEVASAEQGGDKARWIQDMFSSLDSMPRIEKIIWFNLNKERDWRIQSSPYSLQAFKASI